jgi:hypothetical protein
MSSLSICPEACCKKGWGLAELSLFPLTPTLFPDDPRIFNSKTTYPRYSPLRCFPNGYFFPFADELVIDPTSHMGFIKVSVIPTLSFTHPLQ